MNTARMTAEERTAIAQLVRSPGWAVVMVRYIVPRIQQVTQNLDKPSCDLQNGRGDWLRGVKAALMTQVDALYRIASMRNPFEDHALGLLTALTQDYPTQQGDSLITTANPPVTVTTPSPEETDAKDAKDFRRGRAGFPV